MVSRSIGDEIAHSVGCIADPEIFEMDLTARDKVKFQYFFEVPIVNYSISLESLDQVVMRTSHVQLDPQPPVKPSYSVSTSIWRSPRSAFSV